MATLRRLQGGPDGGNVRKTLYGLLGFALLVGLSSSCYTVDTDETAVVIRFGRFQRTETSGLQFKLPFGIESATTVKSGTNRKQEFGFRSVAFDGRTAYSESDWTREALMLTGDLNQAEVEWIVQYTVRDAKEFLFNVRDPEETLRALSESAMRAVIGDRSITEALTLGKSEVEDEAKRTLQAALDKYVAGIEVLRINLQSVLPPDKVKPAFSAVNDAEQERQTLINEALKSYNQSIPSAKGEAEQVVQTAEGYKIDRINRAKGEAERFKSILAEYQRAKGVTKQRLYLEAMADVLPRVSNRVIVDDQLKSIVPLLNLGTKTEGK